MDIITIDEKQPIKEELCFCKTRPRPAFDKMNTLHLDLSGWYYIGNILISQSKLTRPMAIKKKKPRVVTHGYQAKFCVECGDPLT